MEVWLEKFALAVLAAVFISLVLVNVMKFDSIQRVTLGVGVVAVSLFVARTIQVTRAQAKPPDPLAQTATANNPAPANQSAPAQSSPAQTSAPTPKPAKTPKKLETKSTQTPSEEPAVKDKPSSPPQQQAPVQNIAPGGFAISGGTVNNPTVNNIIAPQGRLLSVEGFNKLSAGLKQLPTGTAFLVVYEPITEEMNHLGGQLQQAFKNGGWSLPGQKSTEGLTDRRTVLMDDGPHVFVPDGIHCVGEGAAYDKVLAVLKNAGLKCESANKHLYPPPDPAPTITIFVGRDTGQ